MYLNIGFLPLLGSIVSGFFGRFLGGRGPCSITIVCVSLLYEVGLAGSSTYLSLMTLLESD